MTSSTGNAAAADTPAHGDRSGERFPRAARIRSGREIRLILRTGSRHGGCVVEVRSLPATAGRPRAAVVVPRYGRSNAERNRVKRRLRELVRREWLPLANQRVLEAGDAARPRDIVVYARPGAYGVSYRRLRDSLLPVFDAAC